MSRNILAITACLSGIAHTFMAAESLKKAAKDMGYNIKVETHGSIGTENPFTTAEIEQADVILIASDIQIDTIRFVGKKVFMAKSIDAISNGKSLIEMALSEGKIFGKKGSKVGNIQIGNDTSKTNFLSHLMSGISYMIPMVIAAGLILAIANIYAFQVDPETGAYTKWGFDKTSQLGYLMSKLFAVGQIGFKLMIPLFAGFLAYSIADKPAMAPAMIGAYILNDAGFLELENGAGGGFIGAIIVGTIVGYMVLYLKKIKWPKIIDVIVPIMIIPFITTLTICLLIIYVIGSPINGFMSLMYDGLNNLTNSYPHSAILIGGIIGAMMGFDLGGPVNKTALVFSTAVFTDTVAKFGILDANFIPQTASQAAISVAPLGVWLAANLFKNKFTKDEKVAAKAALGMGLVGVTEGAIPFVAGDPLRMIIANVVGSAVAGATAASLGCKFYGGIGSPLGTFIGYIEQPYPFVTWIFSVCLGILITALLIGYLKKNRPIEEQ